MKTKLISGLVILLFLGVGCIKTSYFGVRNSALGVPEEFEQTEAIIEKAEKSSGAQYCPQKIAKARELAEKGVRTYWACRDKEGLALLAEARKLAKEAELCKALPRPAPPPEPVPVPRPVPVPKPVPVPEPVPVPKPTSPPAAAPFAPKKIIVLKGVNFAFDSARLTPESSAILDEQVSTLKENLGIRVEIGGHTDNIGSEDYNLKLSSKRAKSVRDYFVSKGISPDHLEAVGYGESYPIASNKTEEGRARNRRVELKIFDVIRKGP